MSTVFGYTDVIDKNLVKTSFSVCLGQKSNWNGLKSDSASVDEDVVKRRVSGKDRGIYSIWNSI